MSGGFTKLQRKSSGGELSRGREPIETAQLAQQSRQILAVRETPLELPAVAERGRMGRAVSGPLRARETGAEPQPGEMAQRIARLRQARDGVAVDVGLELEQQRGHRPRLRRVPDDRDPVARLLED